MKKRKEQIRENSVKIPLSLRLKNFFSKDKTRHFLIIFLASFILCAVITLSHQPLDTCDKAGQSGDNWYYFKNARLFTSVWKAPLYYGPGLLFGTLSPHELQSIGFNHDSDFDTFFRAPAFIGYLSFWMVLFGESELSMLFSQVFLYGLIVSYLFLILLMFTDKKTALAGALLLFVHLSFYIAALYTLTELFQTLLGLMLFYHSFKTFRNAESRKRDYFLLALLLFLFTYTKLALKYSYLFLLPLLAYFEFLKSRHDKKSLKKNLAALLVSFFILLFLYQTAVSRGKQPGTSNIGGWRNFYAGSSIEADGFVLNTGFHNREFRQNLVRGTDPFWFNRYSEICKYALKDIIRSRPLAYISMTLKKMGLLLFHAPFHYASAGLLMGLRNLILNPFHHLLVILAVIAFFFLKREYLHLKAYFFVLMVYLAGIYGLSNPDARYFLPLIPFYIILSVLFMRQFIQNGLHKKKKTLLFLLIHGSAFLILFPLNSFLGILISSALALLIIRFSLFLIVVILDYLVFLRPALALYEKNGRILLGLFSLFVVSCLSAFLLDQRNFNHFPRACSQAVQKIVMPENFQAGKEKAYLALDVRPGHTEAFLKVFLNSVLITNISARGLLSCGQEPVIETVPVRTGEKGWILVPLPLESIRSTNHVLISNRGFSLFGRLDPDRKKARLPSLFHRKAGTEDILFGPKTGKEKRVFLDTDVMSRQRESFLSGKIEDRYELDIFILLKEKGDYYIDRRYDSFNQANLKFIALNNPLDNKIVFWSAEPAPEAFQKVYGNLYKYLLGELDRFFSGYSFY